jgi:hypothetical protein
MKHLTRIYADERGLDSRPAKVFAFDPRQSA